MLRLRSGVAEQRKRLERVGPGSGWARYMTTSDDLLGAIAHRIEEAQRMVTEQKGRVARLEATGVDRALAELTLRALEANLKRFQNHSDWFERKELNPPEPPLTSNELAASS